MPSKKYSKKENSQYGFHKSYRATDLIEKKHQNALTAARLGEKDQGANYKRRKNPSCNRFIVLLPYVAIAIA